MTQMNLFMKQQQSHRHREETCGCQGGEVEERWSGKLGLADILSHYGLLMDSEYSFLCYRVRPCCLSILYVMACICSCQPPTPFLPTPQPPLVCSLCP